jgi:hypothetical protein
MSVGNQICLGQEYLRSLVTKRQAKASRYFLPKIHIKNIKRKEAINYV